MMKQYLEVKETCADKLLFFRLGDFYELFFDDALTASRELDLTLTGRAGGNKERVPMCGVPFHSADTYIERLVHKGYKVAICEQMEDPKSVKGLVKREIIRVITPGTVTMEHAVASKKNNYIAAVGEENGGIQLVLTDVTTGEALWMACGDDETQDRLLDIFALYEPAEVVYTKESAIITSLRRFITERLNHCAFTLYEVQGDIDYSRTGADYFDEDAFQAAKEAAYTIGILLSYVKETVKADVFHIASLRPLTTERNMLIDASSLRHLEITQNVRDGRRKGTLLDVLDRTKTAMGGRLLRKWLEAPLLNLHDITERQDGVEDLVRHEIMRQDLGDTLDKIYDFERILTRIGTGTAGPKDMTALRESLRILPDVKHILSQAGAPILQRLNECMDVHSYVYDLLCRAVKEEPAAVIRNGGVIRDGYNEELDEIRSISENSHAFLRDLEEREKESTGIKLKIGYTKVFGYYFEISHANTKPIPPYYVRKQTLVNAERYITPELKDFEVKVLTSQERLTALEYKLFTQLREEVRGHIAAMQETARAVAVADSLYSLAVCAKENRYVRPALNSREVVRIEEGRHPIIEQYNKNELFVPNDVTLNHTDHEVLVITGPNMAGKSTYMRQTAVLILMAQTGSFIPAESADICPVDRIFTRIGASDDILTGQSTFMTEMKEVSYILKHATCRSLLILDEIGRGTSTFDGLSIAWAVIEHISNSKILGAKTLFATHYHELTELEGTISGVNNYCIAVKEQGDDIVFLRKIVKGGADKSYGIQVAKLAGVPEPVIARAKELVEELASADITAQAKEIAQMSASPQHKAVAKPDEVDLNQMSIFDTVKDDDIIKELRDLELSNMTPIDALNTLYRLQTKLKNRWQ